MQQGVHGFGHKTSRGLLLLEEEETK
jgi:hypothetical protein